MVLKGEQFCPRHPLIAANRAKKQRARLEEDVKESGWRSVQVDSAAHKERC